MARLCSRAALASYLVLFCAGCAGDRDRANLLLTGPGYDINKDEITAYAEQQGVVYEQIKKLAGLGNDPANQAQWLQFITAGIQYSDRECEAYMDALFWFDRAKRTTANQVNLFGTATAGILGIAQATAKAIAVTAVAFGLTEATVDNIGGGLVYELDPSAVRELVRKLQIAYEAGIPRPPNGYSDRAAAFRALQGYIVLCLPPSIETQVANSLKIVKPEMTPGNAARGTPPVAQIGPIVQLTYAADPNSDLLRDFWLNDDDSINTANEKKLTSVMTELQLDGVTVPEFIYAREHEATRALAVEKLGLK